MSQQSGSIPSEYLRTYDRVHIVGAGPVGLFLTALLQPLEGLSVRLYEKRPEYTRTRMVRLAPYLVADSVASYRADPIDAQSVEAIFGESELDESLAFRRSVPSDLAAHLHEWTLGFTEVISTKFM
jgi:2-polyprenyl-6-methoxyphenol hydroxylase-like FAD-dependent oxidoreductase